MFNMGGSQLCAQTDPEIFFPDTKKDNNKDIAIALCKACPVLSACKSYAENTPGLYGIWGGKVYRGIGYVSPMPY
jgi:WhiB family redox-sensing transcriptional regulator